MSVFLAPTLELARQVPTCAVTIEAEYGATVVEGSKYTAAHHQPKGTPYAGRHLYGNLPGKGRPSPCNDESIPFLMDDEHVLISHMDLDTIGGCLRTMPEYADLFRYSGQQVTFGTFTACTPYDFWSLAEFVDVKGPHRLHEGPAPISAPTALWAFWAAAKANPFRPPKDDVVDATAYIRTMGDILRRILAGDAELVAHGNALCMAQHELDRRTFVGHFGPVILRVARTAEDFCNHLYMREKAVACLNLATGAVTISLAEPVEGVSCREIVQGLWGPDAGGHDGIAGSPRGQVMTKEDLKAAATQLILRLPYVLKVGNARLEFLPGGGLIRDGVVVETQECLPWVRILFNVEVKRWGETEGVSRGYDSELEAIWERLSNSALQVPHIDAALDAKLDRLAR